MSLRLSSQLIQRYLSPEQGSGYLKKPHAIRLSHETIYSFTYSDPIRHAHLKPSLRQGGKQRRKRLDLECEPRVFPIGSRLLSAQKKWSRNKRIGDWECATIIEQDHNSALVTVVDRTYLYTCCSRVFSRSAQVVSQAILRLLRPFKETVKPSPLITAQSL